jgi:glycosyltransferase involved in cell wall biosynthesis
MKHKKELHVVYIITKLELGGAQKVCLALKRGLEEEGHVCPLISGTTGTLSATVQNSPHIYLLDSFTREVSFFAPLKELKNFFILLKQLQRLKRQFPDLIVHTHSTKAGIVGRWAAFCARIKHRVHTVHGYGFHKHQNLFMWSAIYLCELITSLITTHFICVSSEDVKTGIQLFPGFVRKHSIIRAAVDWKEFYQPARVATPFPQESAPFIFGTVACFKKQKNLMDLLEAFYDVHTKHPHARLEVIGDGALRPEFERWIAKRQLNKFITLHGWQDKVAPLMVNWHTFVLSSLWEGLPCAVVEARLLKIPVVCYNTGGIHDVIMQGKNGFLYQPGNSKALAQGMCSLLQNPKLLQKLQDFNEDLRDFNNQEMVKQHLDLYQKLL